MAFTLPPDLNPSEDFHGEQIERELGPPGADFVEPPQDVKYLFICFTNRSGSNYLAELLVTTEFFNLAGEDMNADWVLDTSESEGFASLYEYFGWCVETKQRNGYYCLKVGIGQLAVLVYYGILDRIADNSTFVIIERQDKIAQAISWLIATQTQKFTSEQPASDVEPSYDETLIRSYLYDFAEHEKNARLFFGLNGIVPVHVSYENLIAAPQACVRMVCEALGKPRLECRPDRVKLKPQRTAMNAEWRNRFLNATTLVR